MPLTISVVGLVSYCHKYAQNMNYLDHCLTDVNLLDHCLTVDENGNKSLCFNCHSNNSSYSEFSGSFSVHRHFHYNNIFAGNKHGGCNES